MRRKAMQMRNELSLDILSKALNQQGDVDAVLGREKVLVLRKEIRMAGLHECD
jgi:hypothetical protein